MPYLETPEELANAVADIAGVYGAHDEERCAGEGPRLCCRVCFAVAMTARIRAAVANEQAIAKDSCQRYEAWAAFTVWRNEHDPDGELDIATAAQHYADGTVPTCDHGTALSSPCADCQEPRRG